MPKSKNPTALLQLRVALGTQNYCYTAPTADFSLNFVIAMRT